MNPSSSESPAPEGPGEEKPSTSGTHPSPDRSDHGPQQNLDRPRFPERDWGSWRGRFPDGRPYIVEIWDELEMSLACRTVIYSTEGTEDWSEEDHLALLETEGILKGQEEEFAGSIALTEKKDASGNPMWFASVVISRY